MADIDVLLLMGSSSDWKHLEGAVRVMDQLGLSVQGQGDLGPSDTRADHSRSSGRPKPMDAAPSSVPPEWRRISPVWSRPTHCGRYLECRCRAGSSTGSTHCCRRCRCREGFRWRPSPSARRERRTPPTLPRRWWRLGDPRSLRRSSRLDAGAEKVAEGEAKIRQRLPGTGRCRELAEISPCFRDPAGRRSGSRGGGSRSCRRCPCRVGKLEDPSRNRCLVETPTGCSSVG